VLGRAFLFLFLFFLSSPSTHLTFFLGGRGASEEHEEGLALLDEVIEVSAARPPGAGALIVEIAAHAVFVNALLELLLAKGDEQRG
jgi:hypothetical protein